MNTKVSASKIGLLIVIAIAAGSASLAAQETRRTGTSPRCTPLPAMLMEPCLSGAWFSIRPAMCTELLRMVAALGVRTAAPTAAECVQD